MIALFPLKALKKMRRDSKFRICRGYDDVANASYFAFFASSRKSSNVDRYFVFAVNVNHEAVIFHAQSANCQLIQLTQNYQTSDFVICIAVNPMKALGDFVLDYRVDSLSISPTVSVSRVIRTIVMILVAMTPGILFISHVSNAKRWIIYLFLFMTSYSGFIYYYFVHAELGRRVMTLIYYTLALSTFAFSAIDILIRPRATSSS